MKAIIGRKIGMTQILSDDGRVTAVTLIHAEPCTVTQIKSDETDGYNAVQIGWGKTKKQTKPLAGHTKKSKSSPKVLKEIREDSADNEVTVGDTIDVSGFAVGDKVTVSGTSKGKGFAGTVKRWNFNTGPKTHGSRNYRKPGSIGSMYPQKIFKGKKMAGRMGYEKNTVKGLKVAVIDIDNNLLGVTGAVPGPRRGVVLIKGVR